MRGSEALGPGDGLETSSSPQSALSKESDKLKPFLIETIIALAVASALFFKERGGVFSFCFSLIILAALVGLELIKEKKNPDIAKFEKELAEIRTIVEQLVMRIKR